MKITAMAMMAVLASASLHADDDRRNMGQTVTVCMARSNFTTSIAEAKTSKMFAGIGVTIQWHLAPASCPAQGILISLTGDTPPTLLPGSLAYTEPFKGKDIRVFIDRINPLRDRVSPSTLLAHLLAHELTHMLQAHDRHSDQGVMKARWNSSDYGAMGWKPLSWTQFDIDLIHSGMAKRAPNDTGSKQ